MVSKTVSGSDERRLWLEQLLLAFVLAVAEPYQVWVGRKARPAGLGGALGGGWKQRAIAVGMGMAAVPRAAGDTTGMGQGILIRRSLAGPSTRAYDQQVAEPADLTLAEVVRVAGSRWKIEEGPEEAKGEMRSHLEAPKKTSARASEYGCRWRKRVWRQHQAVARACHRQRRARQTPPVAFPLPAPIRLFCLPDLTAAAWELVPPQQARAGRPGSDRRLLIEHILWKVRAGVPWRRLPARRGSFLVDGGAKTADGTRSCTARRVLVPPLLALH